jgi:hypothetical protein
MSVTPFGSQAAIAVSNAATSAARKYRLDIVVHGCGSLEGSLLTCISPPSFPRNPARTG